MKHDINRWIFEIPLEDIQVNEYDETANNNPCICCNKEVKNQKYFVHLLTNGNLVSTDQPFNSNEDQGFFPIGNTCKNKLPNNFYFKIETNK